MTVICHRIGKERNTKILGRKLNVLKHKNDLVVNSSASQILLSCVSIRKDLLEFSWLLFSSLGLPLSMYSFLCLPGVSDSVGLILGLKLAFVTSSQVMVILACQGHYFENQSYIFKKSLCCAHH